jgi:hypothetical protein
LQIQEPFSWQQPQQHPTACNRSAASSNAALSERLIKKRWKVLERNCLNTATTGMERASLRIERRVNHWQRNCSPSSMLRAGRVQAVIGNPVWLQDT